MQTEEFIYNKELKETCTHCLDIILKEIKKDNETDIFEFIIETLNIHDIHLDDFTDTILLPQNNTGKFLIAQRLAEQKYDCGLFIDKTKGLF